MTTTKIALFVGAAVVVAGGLILAIRMNPPTSTNDGHGTIAAPVAAVKQAELSPFTHVASIPASVDPSTIRFEKLRTVELASKTKTTTDDSQDCKERHFQFSAYKKASKRPDKWRSSTPNWWNGNSTRQG